MLFSSMFFLGAFLPAVLAGHTLLQWLAQRDGAAHRVWQEAANAFLLAASLVFYAWGEPRHLLVLGASIGLNYAAGLAVASLRTGNRQHRAVAVAVVLNLGLLIYYKYMNFFMDAAGMGLAERIAQPLGVSFFTFRGISYVLDVSRGVTRASRSPLTFGCYMALFPQLVAGPIDRHPLLAPQLAARRLDCEGFAEGARRFILGLAKKALLADTLAKVADAAFNAPAQELSWTMAWVGLVCYTLQIFFDFSGYTDMAVGLARMLGLRIAENFNYPYIARSVREFWQRWHMSLSSWFRDYLYIPLGGNRRGSARTAFNLFMVFFLCGMWHGAGWAFIAWGAYHGLCISLERFFPVFFDRMPRLLQHGYLMLAIMLGWTLFRAPTLAAALDYYGALVGLSTPGEAVKEVLWHLHGVDVQAALLLGVLFSLPTASWIAQRLPAGLAASPVFALARTAALAVLFAVSMAPLAGKTFQPFIYAQF
ncbi:MBOAT family O-acyltransferase [Megalodesulfovibrio gigas]|uniref:Putative AlgI n=1 Tax=Megalodesulfovibrio gigas (strain ATCC 19364 / DSM 1382 / NCIMB 9332 / VKM B-1759) TaxID=1121448 RepID=T2GAN1_MEGG1|nr:MBOAT family protein [Megalodesulfovibrio gigas]AGW13630.1 putative AlgI [Megalodesulfovibrio gigas DSM 1382 = ATCC 19364]